MTDPNAQPPVDPAAGQPQQPAAPGREPYTQPPAPEAPQYSQPPAPEPPQYSQPPAPEPPQYSQPPAGAGAPQQPYAQPPAAPGAQQQQQPYGQNAAPAAPLTEQQDKSYAMWAHLGGAISFLAFFTGWLALLAIVPALVIYLAFGKRGRLTKQESKEALNFQITMVGAMIVWAIIAAIITAALLFSAGYGVWVIVLLIVAVIGWALVVIDVVFSIIGAVRVNAGGSYRYPFALRFIK